MRVVHEGLITGHPGCDETIAQTQRNYWWPDMRVWIADYVQGCAKCQQNKIITHRTRPPMYKIPTDPAALPFQQIAMDLIIGLPESNRHDSILTIVDHGCSRAAVVTGIQGRKPRLVVWLRTGVSSGNRPTNVIENAGNTAGIARRLGCLECLGCLSWMPWESSGISEVARVTNVRFYVYGLMIRLAERSVGCVCYTYSALRYDLMGIVPRRGFPCD